MLEELAIQIGQHKNNNNQVRQKITQSHSRPPHPTTMADKGVNSKASMTAKNDDKKQKISYSFERHQELRPYFATIDQPKTINLPNTKAKRASSHERENRDNTKANPDYRTFDAGSRKEKKGEELLNKGYKRERVANKSKDKESNHGDHDYTPKISPRR